MSPAVPATPDDITSAWLSTALGSEADGSAPPPVPTRIGEEYGFASELYRVSVRLRGCPSTCIVKLWSTVGPGGVREAPFYREFGGQAGIPAPGCLHAAIDRDARRGVLVLEDIADGEQGDCLETIDAERAVRVAARIAELHARWWKSSRLKDVGWLPSASVYSRDEEWFDSKKARFRERFGDRLDPELRSLFESARTVVQRSDELLARLPETLIHGDLHLDNVLFARDGRVVVLDWARVARGPAALDLCEVLSMVEPADRTAVLDAYRRELHHRGVSVGDGDLVRAVTGAMLRKFVICTYGLADWHPASPREERILHDAIARAQDAVLASREQHGDRLLDGTGLV